jgi:hypothetical protein
MPHRYIGSPLPTPGEITCQIGGNNIAAATRNACAFCVEEIGLSSFSGLSGFEAILMNVRKELGLKYVDEAHWDRVGAAVRFRALVPIFGIVGTV